MKDSVITIIGVDFMNMSISWECIIPAFSDV